jgi:hypothetical protein
VVAMFGAEAALDWTTPDSKIRDHLSQLRKREKRVSL